MGAEEPLPEIPRAGVGLTRLSDECWIYRRNQALEQLDESGTTKSLGQYLDGKERRAVVVTVRGAKTGRPRRVPLLRVEHNGCYAAVASRGGSAKTPAWYYNLKANPDVQLQDLTTIGDFSARELVGDERAVWWDRAVQAFEPFACFALKAGRLIPSSYSNPPINQLPKKIRMHQYCRPEDLGQALSTKE